MIFTIAWRNIWRNKIRSLVIMMSIAIGLFAGIMVLSLYKGMLRSRVKTVIYSEVGHLQLHDKHFKNDYEPIYTIKNGEAIANTIQKYPEVKAVAKRSITMGMLTTTTGSAGIQINGVETGEEVLVSQLDKKIIKGNFFDTSKLNQILIGNKLASKMKLKLGNKLVLTFTDIENNIVSAAFRVSAIFESDNAPLDEKNVYIRKQALNAILGIGDQLHEICILLNKDEDLLFFQKKLQLQYKNYLIESWKEISPESDLMVYTVDITSYIIISIILFALAFGIINTMLMAVLERTKEIGMMMALGMNKFKLFMLIFSETVFLTTAGMPFGIFFGWAVSNYYHTYGIDWVSRGKEMMNSFGFNTTIYPEFPSEKLVMVILFVFATALISCIYPAIKALQLKPIDALRK